MFITGQEKALLVMVSPGSNPSWFPPLRVPQTLQFKKEWIRRWLLKLLISMEMLNFRRPWNSVPPNAQEQMEFLDGQH